LHGIEPAIISKKVQSVIYGAQYLHKPIPGLTSQASPSTIRTHRIGVPEVYAERVYGLGTMPTSWDKVRDEAQAWDLRETYAAAWTKFQDSIADWTIGPEEVSEFTGHFDLVISTVPLWAICLKPNEHYFKTVNTLVRKDIEGNHDALSTFDLDSNWVVYNGTHAFSWYRASNIFGHKSLEARAEPHLVTNKKWEPGFKIVGTDCDCHPNVIRAGRMGTWQRGVLTHHAFERTLAAIAEQFGSIQPGASHHL
jgi:hypothetical protein